MVGLAPAGLATTSLSFIPPSLVRKPRAAEIAGSAIAVLGAIAVAAAVGAVGADSRWLAALGRDIVETGGVPDGVPYAAAASATGWPNVLVLAELLFHAFHGLGEHGFLLGHVVAVGLGFTVLAWDARRGGAADTATALVLLAIVVGAFTTVAVARLQLFSVALFPLTLWLLRRETRNPSRWIWLLVPVIALWGNLHGAVLVGLAVAAAYLLFERARVNAVEATLVGLASVMALFANAALLETADYYRGVLANEAARRGVGLWEPLSLGSPFDMLFVAIAAVLLFFALRARPALWEVVALAGLVFLTLRTARSGVWLLFTLAGPAARALPVTAMPRRPLALAVAAALAAVTLFGLVRGPRPVGATDELLDAAVRRAGHTPILAEGLLAEQVALAGGTVWVSNPLDAFARDDQRLYVDWLEGLPSGDAALEKSRVILVHDGSRPEARVLRSRRFEPFARDARVTAYSRR